MLDPSNVTVGGVTVARTGSETIGGEEAGYVFFPMSAHGRAMLAGALGNHLQAELTLSAGTSVARGTIALVAFS